MAVSGFPVSSEVFSSVQVHVEQELLIYEAFPYDQQQPQNNLKVRFKKVSVSSKKVAPGRLVRTPVF